MCAVHSTQKEVQRVVQIYRVTSPLDTASHGTGYRAPSSPNTLLTTFVVNVR